MTDVVETEPTETVESAEPVTEPKPKAAPKPKAVHSCLCASYEVADPSSPDSVFATGCIQTTASTFAQGHDARLVSFLVDGFFDGYTIRQAKVGENGATSVVTYATPSEAVADVSAKLQDKAERATANREARDALRGQKQAAKEAARADKAAAKAKAKEERDAAKAAEKAAAPHVEVAAGSVEGDRPELADGETRIKVGRWEYTAMIDEAGNATYTDGSGAEKTVGSEQYQIA